MENFQKFYEIWTCHHKSYILNSITRRFYRQSPYPYNSKEAQPENRPTFHHLELQSKSTVSTVSRFKDERVLSEWTDSFSYQKFNLKNITARLRVATWSTREVIPFLKKVNLTLSQVKNFVRGDKTTKSTCFIYFEKSS